MYIERILSKKIKQLSTQYPVVSITGPRQSGKTTLVKHVFPGKQYISLEDPSNLEFALKDPKGFLAQSVKGLIIDEAQKAPELFSYIQTIVDEQKKKGMFILTGSQNFLLLEKITQSLAGRAAIIKLLPFSQAEYNSKFSLNNLYEIIKNSMYPPIYDKKLNVDEWFANYLTTYIERDVRTIKNVDNLTSFQRFLKLCAGRCSQILNLSSLANDCGISHNTAKSWLTVLEASYIVQLLPPYYKNFSKRVIKAPKLYFLDAGFLCYLLDIESSKSLITHSLKGQIFETYIYSELVKMFLNAGKKVNLYYWRNKTGNEIDFIIPKADKIVSLEVKSGETITTDYFKNINYWQSLTKDKNSFLVYAGKAEQKRTNCQVIPWNQLLTKIKI